MHDLTALGWDDVLAEEFEPHAQAGLIPGRIAVQHRGAYDVLTADGELRCDVKESSRDALVRSCGRHHSQRADVPHDRQPKSDHLRYGRDFV